MDRRPLNYCSEDAFVNSRNVSKVVAVLPWGQEQLDDWAGFRDSLRTMSLGDVLVAIEEATCEHCGNCSPDDPCDCDCECVSCGRKGYEVEFYCGLECADCALRTDEQ